MIPIPPTLVAYLAVAAAACIAGWLGVKTLEHRGAARERAKVERATMEAELSAHEHRIRAQQAIDAVTREKAAEVAATETELKELRDARGNDKSDPVVFDERWADWLRGKRSQPGG
jgi:hypothetical protein